MTRLPSLVMPIVAAIVLIGPAVPATAQAPDCVPGTPSALQFTGLPSRIMLGREELFALDYDDYDWDVASKITITMQSDGRTFFRDVTDDELADMYVRLDLGDGPATITASFEQEQGTLDQPLRCRRSISARTRGYRHFGAINRCDAPSYRPWSIIIACGDGNYGLSALRWHHWNRAVASARGNAYANDCVPYCAAGHFHRYRVRVRVFRPRRMGPLGYGYTRLRVSFPGARPPGAPRVHLYKAAEDDVGYFWR